MALRAGHRRPQQAIAPDTLVLGLTQGFYVTEQDLLLSPGDRAVSGRTLYQPAPYLQFLDEGEVAAIVGHELAHFIGEDTAYRRRFAPLYAGMGRALAAMHSDVTGLLLLRGPLQLADHTMERSGSISRCATGAACASSRRIGWARWCRVTGLLLPR